MTDRPLLIARTMRCYSCKAKTTANLTQAQLDTFNEAMDLGIQEGKWELYGALGEEVDALCYKCLDILEGTS